MTKLLFASLGLAIAAAVSGCTGTCDTETVAHTLAPRANEKIAAEIDQCITKKMCVPLCVDAFELPADATVHACTIYNLDDKFAHVHVRYSEPGVCADETDFYWDDGWDDGAYDDGGYDDGYYDDGGDGGYYDDGSSDCSDCSTDGYDDGSTDTGYDDGSTDPGDDGGSTDTGDDGGDDGGGDSGDDGGWKKAMPQAPTQAFATTQTVSHAAK